MPSLRNPAQRLVGRRLYKPAVPQLQLQVVSLKNEPAFSLLKMSKMAAEAKTWNRNDFMKYWVDLTLDPGSAYSKLQLTDSNKKVRLTDVDQGHTGDKQFLYVPQVLCSQPLIGESYFEVEWTGMTGVGIALSEDSIERKTAGDESRFGCNPVSCCFTDGVQRHMLYNDVKTPLKSCNNIVGVYFNPTTGKYTLFSISPDLEDMTLLYPTPTPRNRMLCFKADSENIYAGFWLREGSDLTIRPKIESK